METELLKTKKIFRENSLSSSLSSYRIDLPALVEKMKTNAVWLKGDLNAMVLLKNPVKQVLLTVLHERTKVSSFQSDNSVTFQVIEGRLKFYIQNKTVILNKGQLLTLQEKVKYSFTNNEESAFLITIKKNMQSPDKN